VRSPVVLALVFLFASVARGQESVAPVASGVSAVLDLVRKDQLRQALRLAAEGAPGEEGRRLALLDAVVRAACFSLDRQDDEADVKRVLGLAGERVQIEDLPLLRALAEASSRAMPYARAIARRGYARIDATVGPRVLVSLLEGEDDEAKHRALAAVGERLAVLRARVEAGGELGPAEQAELADPDLTAALVGCLTSPSAKDLLPHDLGAQASPSAVHALALVEAPAIPALEAAVRRGRRGAEEALAAVRGAALERCRRHPRSTWSSASGSLPSFVPGAIACPACKHLLPDGARFCPVCSAATPGAACARCGQLSQGDICPRCGGLSGAAAKAAGPAAEGVVCEKCGEHVAAGDHYCRRCGAKREDAKAAEPRPQR
jgi:RNA polymerase subunit RPABC4/transcription elongation factor Spt4